MTNLIVTSIIAQAPASMDSSTPELDLAGDLTRR
jgi:hypothetical protein